MSAFDAHGITILQGDCLEVIRELEAESIDAVVTDPPAGISFMGRGWDGNRGGRDAWIAWLTEVMAECYRVLKPGAHALVWALPRTSHWTGMAIEGAGFEVRDRVVHITGQGFPKSLDVSKAIDKAAGAEREVVGVGGRSGQRRGAMAGDFAGEWDSTAPATPDAAAWEGWGTALKPAAEDWWLARKPLAGTVAATVLRWGTGALNIDATRIDAEPRTVPVGPRVNGNTVYGDGLQGDHHHRDPTNAGRWPANVCMDEDAARLLDSEVGDLVSGANPTRRGVDGERAAFGAFSGQESCDAPRGTDRGGPSRFFYTAKAGAAERDGTSHETVKPLDLMRWLVRLVTPPNGLILDPFLGSGTTAIACQAEGFACIGIEREPEYVEQAIERINRRLDPANARSLERDREPDPALLSLFDTPGEPPKPKGRPLRETVRGSDSNSAVYSERGTTRATGTTTQGRWPSNVILDREAAAALDAEVGERVSGGKQGGEVRTDAMPSGWHGRVERDHATFGDAGGPSRFFLTVGPAEEGE